MKANQNARKDFKDDMSGVSPVVATLMLVLVAAGAAVGLNVWMKGFQDDSTTDVATPGDTQTLTIAGSSTVYEFSKAALEGDGSLGLTAFEEFARQAGNPVKVELEKGGSGAGRQAVGLCLVDIGSSSSPVKKDDFDAWPDCDRDGQKDFGRELNTFKVATDAVVFATLATNTHCAAEEIMLTMDQAFQLYTTNAHLGGGSYSGTPPTDNVVDTTGDGTPNRPLDTDLDGNVTWGEIPTDTINGVCDGDDPTAPVHIFDRSDPGGTSEIASLKLFGQDQNQLEDFGVTLHSSRQGDGNQGVLTAVQGCTCGDDALFFTSFGYAANEGLNIHRFGNGEFDKNSPTYEEQIDSVRMPSSSNIKSEDYDATRPILYITAGKPDAVEQLYLDFVMNAHRNQLISELAAFESIY